MSSTESSSPFFTDPGIADAIEQFDQWARQREQTTQEEIDHRRDKFKYEAIIFRLATGVILALTDQTTPEQIKAIYLREGSRYLSELIVNFDDLFPREKKRLQQEIEEGKFAFNNQAVLEGYGTFCLMLMFMGQALNSFDFKTGKIDDQFKQNLVQQRDAAYLEKDQTGISAVQNFPYSDLYAFSDEFQQGFLKGVEVFLRVATTAYEQIIPDYDRP